MSKLPDNVVLRVEPIPDNVNQASCAGCFFRGGGCPKNNNSNLLSCIKSPLIGFSGRFIWFVEVKDEIDI